jgi:hypothetical protein
MPRQGANLRESRFIAQRSDTEMLAFLRSGRRPTDPASVMGLIMPARGGNQGLDDVALTDLVAFLRELQEEAKQEAAELAGSPAPATGSPAPATQPAPVAVQPAEPFAATAD